MLPDDAIVGSIEPKLPNRFGVGGEIREQRAEFEAKILVELQLHAAVRTLRSRSAAQDRGFDGNKQSQGARRPSLN